MTDIATTPSRNIDLERLAALLREQSARALDVIAGSGAIRAEGCRLVLNDTQPVLGPDGVTMTAGTYTLNDLATTQLADKLGIPVAYLRRTHTEAPELFDTNVNGWLARTDRRFLIRVLRDEHGGGITRAVLSDKYSRIDNSDVLFAALDGIRAAGAPVQIDGCDLSDKRMYVRVTAPTISALAPALLANYRSPFTGQHGKDLPVVWAGFVISNSEVGAGAFTIAPRLVVQVCRNGMVLAAQGTRRTHLGSRHDEDGVIAWSAETTAKTLDLITARTRDAVAAYLDPDYLTRIIRDLEADAGKPITDPDTTIKTIATRLRYTDDQATAILAHFITGADISAGGIMHAITSLAQTLDDPDTAHDLETTAIQAMHLATTL
jgi:hypothetical protein